MNTVSRVIISQDNRVLLGMRSSGVEAGKWSILGGKPDANEDPNTAAIREILEEIGIALNELVFLFTDTYNKWLSYYYHAVISEQEFTTDTEHSDLAWFSESQLDEMESQIAFNHYLMLKKYL